MKKVTILDYNVGNILNVFNAFKNVGADISIAQHADEVSAQTDLLVLPGVGAFGNGIKEVKSRGFDKLLINFNELNKPIIGICLGMQMLFENSYEMGEHNGLGLLPGRINKIPSQVIDGKKFPVPHVGWNKMISNQKEDADEGIVYFVHSYYAQNIPSEILSSYVCYGDLKIPAIVKKDNILAFQFHPEKSGEYGLELIKKYLNN